MKSNPIPFSIDECMQRVSQILSPVNNLILEQGDLDLTNLQLHQTAVFKAACISVTIHVNRYDIENNELLAKQYKCLISEFGAVINENVNVVEISFLRINVMSALVKISEPGQMNSVIDVAAKLTSLLSILNKKFSSMGLGSIDIGIGIDYSNIRITNQSFSTELDNEYLWSGDAVDTSYLLSQKAKTGLLSNSLMITKSVYDCLSDRYKSFFSYDNVNGCFSASLINKYLESWSNQNL